MIKMSKNFNYSYIAVRLLDTNLKGTHPGNIPAKFGLIWFTGVIEEDLNVIFYQNMPNLHNLVKSFFQPIYTDYAN
jgi:hypothetical protein